MGVSLTNLSLLATAIDERKGACVYTTTHAYHLRGGVQVLWAFQGLWTGWTKRHSLYSSTTTATRHLDDVTKFYGLYVPVYMVLRMHVFYPTHYDGHPSYGPAFSQRKHCKKMSFEVGQCLQMVARRRRPVFGRDISWPPLRLRCITCVVLWQSLTGLLWKIQKVTWLILPVVICLSQRLSHACLSINIFILWNCVQLIISAIIYLMVNLLHG